MDKIKAFGMTNNMILSDLTQIEKEFSIELDHTTKTHISKNDKYYPQFSMEIRGEAKKMSSYYEMFYCLERSIREMVSQVIESIENSEDWWNKGRIPQTISDEVQLRIQKEVDSGVSRRSTDEIDYTTFGELSQIKVANWDIFGSIFSSKKAVQKVMTSLNTTRGPIAHCSPLAEDEILRLTLTLRDWFRLME